MKKIRLLSAVLAMAMLSSIFFGCSQGDNGGSSSEQQTSSASQSGSSSEASGGEAVTLKMLYFADSNQEKIIEEACRKYESETPGVTIETQVVPGDGTINTLIPTLVAADNLPDVSFMGEAEVIKYGAKGVLYPLDDMIASGQIAEKLDAVTIHGIDGKVYGIGLSNQLQLMFYNKKLFDEAGIEYPPSDISKAWDWDYFVEVATKLTKDANGKTPADEGFDAGITDQYGVAFNSLWQFYHMWAAYANGGGIVSADGKELLWDKPESLEGIQKVADLVNVNKVAPPVGSAIYSGIGTADQALISGDVAMYINGSWDLANAAIAKADSGVEYGVAALPKMKKAANMNCGGPFVMYQSTEHPEEAGAFYAFMLDPNQVIDIIKTGAWLPNEASWYTDQDKLDLWISSENYGEGAAETIISYSTTEGAVAQWPAYYVPGWDAMMSISDSVMDSIWTGAQTADEALTPLMPEIREKFELGAENFS